MTFSKLNIGSLRFWDLCITHCTKFVLQINLTTKVRLGNGWNSKQMITEGDTAILLETTLHAFRNQEKTKQRSTIELECYIFSEPK